MGQGNTLDDKSLRELKQIARHVRSQTISPVSPLTRVRTREISAARGLFPVKVYMDGGVAGSDSTNCTWTYTVKTMSDGDLKDGSSATSIHKGPLANVRVNNVTYDNAPSGSFGVAFYGTETAPTLHLWQVIETPSSADCDGDGDIGSGS